MAKVKHSYNIQLGKMIQNAQITPTDEKVNYLKALNVQWEKIVVNKNTKMWANTHELKQYQVNSGDLLVCEGGEVGRAALLDEVEERTIIQNSLHRVRNKKHSNNSFLLYYLYHINSKGWFNVLCNKATIAHFTVDKFSNLEFLTPSCIEQKEIADFLDKQTTKIDALVKETKISIELLKEHRTALISAAVTGKIDVRNFEKEVA